MSRKNRKRTRADYPPGLRSDSGWAALRARNKAAVDATRLYIIGIKSQPCADCGDVYDPVCMDFDHRPGETKLHNIGRLARSAGAREILDAEIEKCDVVCANCHRLRTKTRGQWSSLVRQPATPAAAPQLALFKEAA